MRGLRYFIRRLRALWRSEDIHEEIAEEMRFHIELRAEENIRRGMTPEDARREAERQFGRFGHIKERGYEVQGGRWLEATWQDLRYGARMLFKTPGFTAAATLSLALGIGANTAIFSLADKVLIRKLPVHEPERLVVVSASGGRGVNTAFNYPDFADYRAGNQVFEGLVCYTQRALTMSEGGRAERIQGMIVSGNYFTALRVQPALGRGFLPEEDKTRGTHPVVVLSYGLWQKRFGADPGLLGKSVILNGYKFTVVGIAPSEFTGTVPGVSPDVYVPVMMQGQVSPGWRMDPLFGPRSRDLSWLEVLGRLKPGVSREQAAAAMTALGSQIARANPNQDGSPRSEPNFILEDGSRGHTYLLQDLRFPLQMLMATVGLILLIACANVANLLLARAGARHKEIAVRLAIGAGRARLIRQMLTESLLLSALGGLAGVAIAAATSGLVVSYTPPNNFSTLTLDNGLDLRALGFTFAISLLTGILFGLAPALSASRTDLIPSLKDETTAPGKRRRRLNLRNLLVVAQVALSLMVIIGAGLCVRSLRKLQAIDSGFDPARALVMSADVSLSGYNNEAASRRFWPGQNPIGRRIADARAFFDTEFKEIVGVVKDSKYFQLTENVRPTVYVPLAQDYRSNMALHIRTAGEPVAMLAAARREAQALDASLPFYDIKTLEEQKNGSLYTSRMAATLLTVFGLLALSLAAVGLYGVMAYSVNRRRREIGIRIALGAQSRDVLRQVIAEGMTIVAIGLSLGLVGALAATRLVEGFLYGVTATDPISFAGAALLLVAVALLANCLPARQASRTDPLITLRRD